MHHVGNNVNKICIALLGCDCQISRHIPCC